MNLKTIILIGAAVAIPVGGYAFYQHVKANYDFSFQGVSVTSITATSINLTVQFLIMNNTGLRLNVFDSAFDIIANGTRIGVAYQPTPLVIPDKMMTVLTANVIVDKSGIQSSLFDFISAKIFGKQAGVELMIQGNVKVKIDEPVLSIFTSNIAVSESYKF